MGNARLSVSDPRALATVTASLWSNSFAGSAQLSHIESWIVEGC